jgi:RHS repeat-associated protein
LGRIVEENGTAGQITSFVYDPDGNVTEIEDPMGRITTWIHDELDRLDTIVDPALQLTDFSYDAQDNLLSVLDPRALTTSYAYNGFGEQSSQVSPDTGTSSSPRDAAGNIDAATDARNKTADYAYDALNRVTAIAHADETVIMGYDAGANGRGRLTSMTDGAGSTSWSHDAVGRTTERSQTTDSVTLDVGYGYDLYGRLSTLTTPSGQTLTYEYTNGQLSGLKVNGVWILNQVAYQPFGPIKSWTWGNGATTTRTYDTDGRLTQVSSAGTSSYTFFLDGQIASRTDDFTVSLPSTAGTATFEVSTNSNRLQSATGLINRTYGYDLAGNTTSDGTRTFTYNDAGRMKTSTSASGTTTYSYNGLGERVKKQSSAATTYFAYDEAGHLLGEYDAAADLIQETVWLGDIPVAVLKPNGGSGISVFYVHTDHLNTPRRITRPSDNAIVWRWGSDPFGATAANEDPDGDTVTFVYQLRFPGQYFDSETGLHYNYFRDYDAVTGRYVQSDPIGLEGGINTYGYVRSNPVSFADPSGLLDVFVGGAGDGRSQIVASYQRAFAKAHPTRKSLYFEHDQSDDIIKAVQAAIAANKFEPINIIGHSWGGSTAASVSRDLKAANVDVSLLVTIDPVSRREIQGAAGRWLNVNAAPSESNGWAGDRWARLGGKWGNWPSGKANSHYDAPYHHNEFGDLFEFSPMGGQSASQVLLGMPNTTCNSTC